MDCTSGIDKCCEGMAICSKRAAIISGVAAIVSAVALGVFMFYSMPVAAVLSGIVFGISATTFIGSSVYSLLLKYNAKKEH